MFFFPYFSWNFVVKRCTLQQTTSSNTTSKWDYKKYSYHLQHWRRLFSYWYSKQFVQWIQRNRSIRRRKFCNTHLWWKVPEAGIYISLIFCFIFFCRKNPLNKKPSKKCLLVSKIYLQLFQKIKLWSMNWSFWRRYLFFSVYLTNSNF